MNALFKKEIRLLLPCCLISLVLTFANWLVPPSPNSYWDMFLAALPFLLCPVMVVMLALDSFGVEISSGVFTSLLAQPVPRQRIWRTKSMLLLAAIVIILIAWWFSFFMNASVHFWTSGVNVQKVMLGTGLFALVVYSGGLWTVLLIRQVVAAFWFTLIVPAALLTISTFFFQDASDNTIESVVIIVLTAYSVAGFIFARWLFLRAQDVAWTGGAIALPEIGWLKRRSGRTRKPQATSDTGLSGSLIERTWSPKSALLGKELQLHSITLFFACALLALHIGVFFLRIYYANSHRNSLAEGVSDFFWMLWLVLPLTIGCTAVAEERKIGVAESQFCLPVSRRWQFAIKFIPAMVFGTLLGGVMPVLLETLARHLGAPNGFFRQGYIADNEYGSGIVQFQIIIIALSAGFTLAAFVASTLARTFLQALSLAVVIMIGCFWFGYSIAHTVERGPSFFANVLWHLSLLPFVIAIPTFAALFLWLVFRNFSHFHERGRLWRGNLLGVLGALVFIAVSSAAIYNRPWEIFEPAEPPHGPAKLSSSTPPTFLEAISDNLLVRLPDGRVWYDHLDYPFRNQPNRWKGLLSMLIRPFPASGGPGQFIAGSNWVSVTAEHTGLIDANKRIYFLHGYLDTVGIKEDGTLWISSESKPTMWTGARMIRFGDETNWQQVHRPFNDSQLLLLIMTDGTLWCWGTNISIFQYDRGHSQPNWPSLRDFQPRQIGRNSDWKEIFGNWPCFIRKTDGSVWQVNSSNGNEALEFQRQTNLDQVVLKKASEAGNAMAYVGSDGSLRIRNVYFAANIMQQESGFLQVGKETNWLAVAVNWRCLVALKSDGSLWRWKWDPLDESAIKKAAETPPTRLGIHNDWIGLTSTWAGVASLAADGSLWFWPGTGYPEMVMKAPKQPQLLGNIFSDQHEVAAIREVKGQP